MENVFASVASTNIDAAINTINRITDNAQFEEQQTAITASVHNAVHAIVDWYERQDKNSLRSEEDELLRAFMYVNNQIKHDSTLVFVTYNISGKMYPYFYPYRYGPPGVCWAEFPDHGSPNSRGKREHYVKMLMDQDVFSTLEKTFDIIRRIR